MKERVIQLLARKIGNGIQWVAGLIGVQEAVSNSPEMQTLILALAGVLVGLGMEAIDIVIHKKATGGAMAPPGARATDTP